MTNQTHNIDGNPFCVDSAALAAVIAAGTPGACGVVPPPPSGTPIYSGISYPTVPGSGYRNVDITIWDSVFGHRDSTDPITPFPGVAGASVGVLQFPGDRAVAIRFVAAAHLLDTISQTSYLGGHLIDMAYSAVAGNFASELHNGSRMGVSTGEGGPTTSTSLANKTLIVVGNTYFLNIRLSAPQSGAIKIGFANALRLV